MNIEGYAFSHCSNLAKIVIPEGVTEMGNGVFWKCTSLVDVSLPSSLNVINDSTFCQCSSLESIQIPENVTRIGHEAFLECSNLKTVYNCSTLNIESGSSTHGGVAAYAENCYSHFPTEVDPCIEDQTCVYCGKVVSIALGHVEEIIPAVEPTTTTMGKTEGKKCSVCGVILFAQEDVDRLPAETIETGVITDTEGSVEATDSLASGELDSSLEGFGCSATLSATTAILWTVFLAPIGVLLKKREY